MNMYLTNAGLAVLYKAQGGKELRFSRFAFGDGELSGRTIQDLTSLISEKLSSGIARLNIKNDKVTVGTIFTNKDLEQGFYFRELGIYVLDPDTQNEVLYLYGNSGATSDYIDSKTGRIIEEYLDVNIIVSNVDNITATIDESLVYALDSDVYHKDFLDEKFDEIEDAFNDIVEITNGEVESIVNQVFS